MARIAVLAPVLLTALLLDTVVLTGLSVRGASPSLVLLTVVAVALADGPEAGAAYGFTAGLAVDLLAGGLVGVFALVTLIMGYLAALLRPYLIDGGLLSQIGIGAAASALAVALHGLVAGVLVLEQPVWPAVLVAMAVVGVGNGVLAPLVLRPVAALLRRVGDRSAR